MGWLEDIGSAADKFLGGTGGQPMTPTQTAQSQFDEYNLGASSAASDAIPAMASPDAGPFGGSNIIEQPAANPADFDEWGGIGASNAAPDAIPAMASPDAISFGDTKITSTGNAKSMSGAESILARDLSADTGITRADYTAIKDLGDTRTQELIRGGLDPLQALEQQRLAAEKAGDTRAERYYQNEWDKAAQSNVGLASEYHHAALESGLPQAVNPFEYAGDISAIGLKGSQARSFGEAQGKSEAQIKSDVSHDVNELAVNLGEPQGMGGMSQLGVSNLIAKIKGEGDLGPYGNLGKPYSSAYGTISLEDQQRIGAAAATSRFNKEGEGWEIKPETMNKFTPELLSSFRGTGYKEVKEPETGFLWTKSPWLQTQEGPDKGFNTGVKSFDVLGVTKGGNALTQAEREGALELKLAETPELLKAQASEVQGREATERAVKSFEVGEPKDFSSGALLGGAIGGGLGTVTGGGLGSVAGTFMGSSVGRGIEKLFGSEKKSELRPTEVKAEITVEKKSEPAKVKSESSRSALDQGMYNMNIDLPFTGRIGSGESIGGQTLETIGVQRGNWIPGSAMAEMGAYRKAKKAKPYINRKISQSRSFNLDAVNGIMSKSIGAGKITFKTPSINTAVASVGSSKVKTKINGDSKAVLGNFDLPSVKGAATKKKKHDVASNIESIVGKITQSTKIKKVKAR